MISDEILARVVEDTRDGKRPAASDTMMFYILDAMSRDTPFIDVREFETAYRYLLTRK